MAGTQASDTSTISPVADDERLYRRILPASYNPRKPKQIPVSAFMPRAWQSEKKPGDKDGLSVNRATLTTIERASTMPHNGKRAHLARFDVESVKGQGLTVKPKSLPDDPSHALIPEMNSLDRRDPEMETRMTEWATALRNSATLVYVAPADQ